MKVQRGGNGRNGDGSWPETDGRGCPVCGAIRGGGHGGDCPHRHLHFDEDGKDISSWFHRKLNVRLRTPWRPWELLTSAKFGEVWRSSGKS